MLSVRRPFYVLRKIFEGLHTGRFGRRIWWRRHPYHEHGVIWKEETPHWTMEAANIKIPDMQTFGQCFPHSKICRGGHLYVDCQYWVLALRGDQESLNAEPSSKECIRDMHIIHTWPTTAPAKLNKGFTDFPKAIE